ncbi:MAG TPA: carbonic anhydrase [Polyangia bacterium]
MKLAKYVVIGQMTLSAILLGVFATRSGASPTPHGPVPTAAIVDREDDEHGGGADKAHASVTKGAHGKEAAGKAKKAKAAKGAPSEAELAWKGTAETPEGEADHGDGHGHGTEAHAAGQLVKAAAKIPPAVNLPTDPKIVARTLLEGNSRFISGRRSPYNLVEQREVSAGGQHPGVMVLGCADSRVPPELIFDRGVGEMFVVRSAGNIAEPVAVGSLEYGAEHLHAKVLLVLGHEKCGAVVAALSETKMPSVNLEAVVGSILPAVKELKGWAEGDELIHLAVEANVRRQAEEVLKRSPILRDAVQKKSLTLLKGVYDLQTGLVRPL